ncbi:transglycosylase domain-containing protein [Gorillibacterium massiliense]|uniref:transglycosylase domain-containing protein n=1 Tax=Gorillibacterium massiliense TaxID=1280390 RepID=UPI0004B3D5F4|nr:transglycosylase domain-containing protein [Gorillibacterium massiliense]
MSKSKLSAIFSPFRKRWVKMSFLVFFQSLKWLIISGIILGFLVGGAVFGYVASVVKDEPVRSAELINEKMSEDSETSFVYFNDNTLIGQMRTDEDRLVATLDEIPMQLQEAVLAIEDSNFRNHNGVDFKGTARAIYQQVRNEPVQTGGSTITQQLARRVFLNLDKEITRKIKEIFLAMRLERVMSKDQILTAYLNKVPYGNGSSGYNAYGIKAAAKGIFDVTDLTKLNIAQCAYLAGLPQQPSNFSNYTSKGQYDEDNIKKAITRQHLVLDQMLKKNIITEAEYQSALTYDIRSHLAKPSEKAYNTYPFLMLAAEDKAAEILLSQSNPNLKKDEDPEKYNEALKNAHDMLLHGGYKIYTTIDKSIYDGMHKISSNDDNFFPTPEGNPKGPEQIGAIMINNKSGAILGMIEGRGYDTKQFNHATQALRQPGSTMKPIAAYVPALEMGKIQPGGVIDDVPIILKDYQKGFHIPMNWDNKFHGLITARVALNQSYNIPAIKLFLNDVGIQEAWRYAREMGITSLTKQDDNAQTGVIGGLTQGVSVEELTNAYSTIANNGNFNDAYMVEKIVGSDGNILYQHETTPKKVFSEQTAYLMTDMMRTVITNGTATDLKTKFKHYGEVPIVGKTGSTQDDADAWFEGYTPDITVGVWAGYEEPKYKLTKKKAGDGVSRAKNIWALIMDDAITRKPELFQTKEFTMPKGIVKATVSSLSGKLPSELVTQEKKLTTDLFNVKYLPQDVDDVLVSMKYITYNSVNYMPNPATPEDFLQEKVVIKREQSISALMKQIEELMKKAKGDDRKPLSMFVPIDADEEAPSEADPRVDDGVAPSAPTAISLTGTGGAAQIAFTASPNADVVGYRLYQESSPGEYRVVPATVVLAGQETVFKTLPAPGAATSYYVTAVDVSGRESTPSEVTGMVMAPGGTDNPGSTPNPGENPDNTSNPNASENPPGENLPGAPNGLKAQDAAGSLYLTWQARPVEEQVIDYRIYFSQFRNTGYSLVGSTGGATEYMNITPQGSGYYRVTSISASGESEKSAPIQIGNTP